MSVGSPAAAFAPTPSYTRVTTIAQGGMGYVELVFRREGRFLRWCARKRLHEQYRSDPTFRSMFMDEARLAGLVRHPNAVGVLDVGVDDDGPFLIMDFVEGVSLSRLIADAVGAGRSIPMQVAVRICMDAARGLHAAHEVRAEDGTVLRLVHRDVSPQNILVGFDGTVRVTDFGIAKALGNSSRTSAGVLKGNMGYLAPEQLRFEEPDRRSDFFSLGVTLYELLSGRRLYPNKTGFDGTRRILTEPPPDIGEVRNDVPPELCELLFEMLAKERDSRPATAAEIASRLEGILAVLIAEEGSVTVSDYMSQHFARQCHEQRAILAAHLKRIESEPAPTLRSLPVAGDPANGPPTLRLPPPSRTGRNVFIALGFACAAGALGLTWMRNTRPPDVSSLPGGAEQGSAPYPTPTPASSTPMSLTPAATTPPAAVVARSSTARSADPGGDRGVPPTVNEAMPRAALSPKGNLRPPRTVTTWSRHKAVAKQAARRARAGENARSPGNPANSAAGDPTRLAVPLFERWQ
ncbi:MAG: protein kinase [Myxococcales bacterium]